MSDNFQFKQFSICQNRAAMKVGTDGVLLGAWVAVDKQPYNVLDIGAGTGLIGLMLAQRTDAQIIDAIEIDDAAYEEAVDNFEQSDWSDRLFCYHASLQDFVDEMDEKYELVISNPPYFNPSQTAMEENRSRARHRSSLSFEVLLDATAKLLSETGSCAFVIPYNEEERFTKIALGVGLYPTRITRVRGTQNSPIKRSLLQLSFTEVQTIENELILENSRHDYTEEYIELVKDFYLKM